MQSPPLITQVELLPQQPLLQVVWFTPHADSQTWVAVLHDCPGAQSVAATHPTQLPAPSQTSPGPQGWLAGLGVWTATPPLHASSVHAFLSSAMSLSSTTASMLPAPSHSF